MRRVHQRLPQGPFETEELRPEERLDGKPRRPCGHLRAEQRPEQLRCVEDPEVGVEGHADSAERAEGRVDGREGPTLLLGADEARCGTLRKVR
jgi:hypothetical protein